MPRVLLLCRSGPGGLSARRARQVARHAVPRMEVSIAHCAYDVKPRELFPCLLGRMRGVPVIVELAVGGAG